MFWKRDRPPVADKGWFNDLVVILSVYAAGVATGVGIVLMAS